MILAVYIVAASAFCAVAGVTVSCLVAGDLPRSPWRPVSRSGACRSLPSLRVLFRQADRDFHFTNDA